MSQSIVEQTRAASPTMWRAAPRADLLWSEFDGELALFHHPSGKTHFVNHATLLLLDTVLRDPKDLTKVVSDLAHAQDAAATEVIQLEVAAMLQRLEALGLVERA